MNHHPAFAHQLPILGCKHNPTTGCDHLPFPTRNFGQDRRLADPETGFPFKLEDQIDGGAGARGNELIQVDEPEPEFTSKWSPNGTLPGTHGADQKYIRRTGAQGVDVIGTHPRNASIRFPATLQ